MDGEVAALARLHSGTLTMHDPFAPIHGLTIEYVDSAAGSRKTLTAVAIAIDRASLEGTKTIFIMPTLELIREMVGAARRQQHVPVVEITSREDEESESKGKPRAFTTTAAVIRHIEHNSPAGGHLLFITHETYYRIGRMWPAQAAEWEIVIDEVPEVILTRPPFLLHDNCWILTSFLAVGEVQVSVLARRRQAALEAKARAEGITVFTKRDAMTLEAAETFIAQGPERSSLGEVEQAIRHRDRLLEKKANAEQQQADGDMPELGRMVRPYFQVYAKDDNKLHRRVTVDKWDDVYGLLAPIPAWLLQGAALFTDWQTWARMVAHSGYGPLRGRLTISGFRRPEALLKFKRVTMMSALFQHTMVHDVWSQLGVEFKPSELIKLRVTTTPLGQRRLRLYWVTDQGWSKRLRDRSGGIQAIFKLILQANIIDPTEPVCVQTNKDDATESDPRVIYEHFANAIVMPHVVRGQNRFQGYHQLIACAALNSYTPDIRWMETLLGIDSHDQRIRRTGQEIYQTMMRLSLRNPQSRHDVTVVLMDKDICEWLPQWFTPTEQVEINEIDSSGVVKRKRSRTGRPAQGDQAMTHAERQRLYRDRRRDA